MSSFNDKDDQDVDPVLISNDVIHLNNQIFNYSDAVSFLKKRDLNKDNFTRMLSWLIVLRIIPDTQVRSAYGFSNLYKKYKLKIRDQLDKTDDPLTKIPAKESRVIIADINRSLSWFETLSQSVNLDDYYTKEVRQHTIRILSLLSLSSKMFSYLQGFDRYVLVCYLLGLIFVSKSGLPTTVAESISFFLSYHLIKMSRPDLLLIDNEKTVTHFLSLDSKIAIHSPEIYAKMLETDVSSLLFALRWQLLVFTDEHDLNGLLYIWDNAIANRGNFSDYIECLSIAHVCQVPVDTQGNLVEVIQHYRDWDNLELVKKADSLMEVKENRRLGFGAINIFLFLMALLLIYVYLKKVFKKID